LKNVPHISNNLLLTTTWSDIAPSRKGRNGLRETQKPKFPEQMNRVPVNARIPKWMFNQLKGKDEV